MFAGWRGRQIKKYQSIQDDLLIIEEPNGLLISQDNKTFLARKWKLTDRVIEILNISIKSGFSKLWVDGHPKGETSHYICFSRTHSKPWEFLIGGEANPPNVKCITVNNTHRKVLDDATLGFHWQNFGGKNLFLTPTNEMLSKLIKVIKNIPHGEFKINKNYKSITNSKLNKVGFRNEQELETFIFNQLVYLGYEPKRQLRFTSNNELERNSIPDIIVEKGNVVFIIELKLHAAHIADLYQLDRYINNKMLLKKFPNKQIIGMLLTGHFDESILNEVRNNLSSLNLYSYTYSNEKINIELNYGNENIKLFDN